MGFCCNFRPTQSLYTVFVSKPHCAYSSCILKLHYIIQYMYLLLFYLNNGIKNLIENYLHFVVLRILYVKFYYLLFLLIINTDCGWKISMYFPYCYQIRDFKFPLLFAYYDDSQACSKLSTFVPVSGSEQC